MPVQLERGDLDHHRQGLRHEQAADDRQHDLVLGGDRDRAEPPPSASEPVSPMKICGRRRVVPEEAEAGPDHGAAEHRQLADAGHEVELQVVGEDALPTR